ncbi:MAG: universal stress protein [Neptuniibacter sp.]
MFKKILVPVDLSHEDQILKLINVATTLAGGLDSELHLLYVDQSLIHSAGYPHLDEQRFVDHRNDAKTKMTNLLAHLPENLTGKSHCREGTAHDQILETAQELQVDAIAMMARKPGISSYFIGSNAERVVRHAPCSVFVIRDVNSEA